MWYQIKSRLNFLLNSSNQHGIHSPFVYDLVTKCFYDKSPYSAYDNLKILRNELTYNQDLVEIKHYYSSSKGRSRQGTVERLHPDGSGIVV